MLHKTKRGSAKLRRFCAEKRVSAEVAKVQNSQSGGGTTWEIQLKQTKDLVAREARRLGRFGVGVEDGVEQFAFFFEHAVDPFFDRAGGEKSRGPSPGQLRRCGGHG